MNTLTKKFALVTVAFLGAASFAGTLHAAEQLGADSRAVHYSDLNLGTVAGAKVLYQRIRVAAMQVCGDVTSRRLEEAAAAKACVDKAIVSSVRAVNSTQLTRAANEHGYEVQSNVSVAQAR